MLVFVTLAAVISARVLGPAVPIVSEDAAKGLAGVYTGSATCPDRGTRLTVTITERAGGLLSAMVRFFPRELPEGATSDSFVLRVQGRYNSAGDTRLRPMRFESRPPAGLRFGAQALVGRFDLANRTFSGSMTGEGCTFSVRHDPAASTESARAPRTNTASTGATTPVSSGRRPAAPAAPPTSTSPAAAVPPPVPAPSALATSRFAKDPRLDTVPSEVRELVLADADKATPYCESTQALSNFFECSCVGQRVFDHRLDTAGYELAMPTPGDIRRNRTPPPKLAKPFSLFFLDRAFNARLRTCVVPAKVEAYARDYAGRMPSLSAAAKGCAVAEFSQSFGKAPAPDMSYVSKVLTDAMLSCQQKHR